MVGAMVGAVGAEPGSVHTRLGARLRQRRQETHLSVAVAAVRIGVPETLLRAWEAGAARPTAAQFLALADLLGTAPPWFFEGVLPPAALPTRYGASLGAPCARGRPQWDWSARVLGTPSTCSRPAPARSGWPHRTLPPSVNHLHMVVGNATVG